MKKLDDVANALIHKEKLDSEEFEDVFENGFIPEEESAEE